MADWIANKEDEVPRQDVLVTDFGNVIVDRSKSRATPEEFMDQRPLPFAIDGLSRAVEALTPARVNIVSRVDFPEIETLYRQWLDRWIFPKTGMLSDREHVRFCKDRVDKGAICYALNATIVIDDRTPVHWSVAKTYGVVVPANVDKHLSKVNQLSSVDFQSSPEWLRRFGFNLGLEDRIMHDEWPEGITLVPNWKQIVEIMQW